ncbi:MAG: hypothetical protein LBE20_06440 [Deltaproteobacteria bacterium]|jgi:hypothetical protein|nr:hypothetical protein [Deltaproteobacteria bacterium]
MPKVVAISLVQGYFFLWINKSNPASEKRKTSEKKILGIRKMVPEKFGAV